MASDRPVPRGASRHRPSVWPRIGFLILVILLAGCDLQELTHDKLFGAPRPVADGGAGGTAPPIAVSGGVYSACDGAALDALVGIAGRHTCSFRGKGSFFFRIDDLPAGVMVTLTAAKPGYRPYSVALDLDRGGVIHDVRLVPAEGDCASNPQPATSACSCTMPSCVSP
jgi:hypothetical protein